MPAREHPTLALTSYGHALCHAAKVALPVITVTVAARDFGVGVEAMGLAITVFIAAMAASSVPAGLAGDRWGTTWVLAAFFWLTGVGAAACALAASYPAFVLAHGVLGFAAGLFHPAALGLLSLSTSSARLGPAMGMFGVAASAGITLTPLVFHAGAGWRAGFLGLASAAFVGALACHLLALSGGLLVGRPAEAAAAAAERRPRASRRNGLLFLMGAMGVNAFLHDGFMAIFPVTVVAAGGPAVDEATLMTFVFVVGGVGQWLGGRAATDLLGTTRYAMLVFGQPLVLLGLAQSLDEPLWPYLLMATFACLNFMTQPIENKLLATFTSTRRRSTAYALKFMVALAIAAPAPWLMTRLMEHGANGAWGFPPLYRLLALLGMTGVFSGWLLLRETTRPASVR